MSNQHTLLYDADFLKYSRGYANQKTFDFNGDGNAATWTDFKNACRQLDETVARNVEKLKGDRVIVALTCPEHNWRLDVDPTYKWKRDPSKKPLLLKDLEEYVKEEYETYIRYSLEADDVLGILLTHKTLVKGKKTIVSEDKDMRTIPGRHYNPGKPELGVINVSPLDADRFHAWQTICGDQVDNYPGCPGVGKDSGWALDVLCADQTRIWEEVLGAYSSKGLTEEHAIVQARLARILRAQDYDFKTKKVIPWEPLLVSDPEVFE